MAEPGLGNRTERSRRWDLLSSPVFAASIATLLLNDHVLKAAAPGLVTGKLSDFAGVAMVAIFLTAVTGRRWLGTGLTVAGFTALKTVPLVAVWAAPVLGGVTLTDETDLVALLVLIPLARWMRSPRSEPRLPVELDRLPWRMLAVGAAVFATTATSCGETGVAGVAAIDGSLFANTPEGVWASEDGGLTWANTGLHGWEGRFTEARFSGQEACVGTRCYQIVRSAGVGASTVTVPTRGVTTVDLVVGDERTSLVRVDDSDLQTLDAYVSTECGLGAFGGVAAVAADGDADGAATVVIAMGDAGLLRGSGDDPWEWVAVGPFGVDDDTVAPLGFSVGSSVSPGIHWALWITRLVIVALPLAASLFVRPIGALATRRRRNSAVARSLTTTIAVVSGLLVIGVIALAGNDDFAPVLLVVGTVVIGVLIAVSLAVVSIAFGRPARAGSLLPPPEATERVG